MTKIMVVGDIHLNKRYAQRSEALLDDIKIKAAISKPDFIVLLGDIFDHHRNMYSDLCTIFEKFLSTVSCKVVGIVGNHDMHDSRTYLPESHALAAYREHPNFLVVDKPILQVIGGLNIGFVPYTPPGYFARAISEMPAQPELVFAHQEFIGCEMAASHRSTVGDPLPEAYWVISGHIHGYQRVGKVWYPGTPCQHQFGDGMRKNYSMIEVKEDGSYKVIERFKVDIQRFITFETNVEGVAKLDLSGQDIYRVVLIDEAATLMAFKRTQAYKDLTALAKIKLKPVAQQIHVATQDTRLKTFEQRLKEYSSEAEIQDAYKAIFE